MNLLIILLIIGVTIVTFISGIILLIVLFAPLSITFRTSKSIGYELSFGVEMLGVWQSLDWFRFDKLYYDQNGAVEDMSAIFSAFCCEKYWAKRQQRELEDAETEQALIDAERDYYASIQVNNYSDDHIGIDRNGYPI